MFIDIGSFEKIRPGEPWFGYRQFCQLFYNPLVLQARRDLPLQPLLRGSLEGISPTDCAHMLRRRDRLRRDVFTHVVIHARAERRYEAETRDVRGELKAAGFGPKIIAAQVNNLRRSVERLRWGSSSSEWSDYTDRSHYADADLSGKDAFVTAAAKQLGPTQVLDLGANDGRFSRLVAEHADRVIAVDSDHLVIDRLHATLRDEGNTSILPLVIDLADPSPARGWRGRERSSFAHRVRSDLVLCLAVVHHLALTNTVPFDEIVAFLAELGPNLVVEFPHRDDSMVTRLLSRKRDGLFDHYNIDAWETALERSYAVDERGRAPVGQPHALPLPGPVIHTATLRSESGESHPRRPRTPAPRWRRRNVVSPTNTELPNRHPPAGRTPATPAVATVERRRTAGGCSPRTVEPDRPVQEHQDRVVAGLVVGELAGLVNLPPQIDGPTAEVGDRLSHHDAEAAQSQHASPALAGRDAALVPLDHGEQLGNPAAHEVGSFDIDHLGANAIQRFG